MTLDVLEGRVFGSHSYRLCAEKVAEFVRVTGDDPKRWTDAAPPGFAAALLFVVAPDLLADPLVDGPVVHGDQSFTWHRPLPLESELAIEGTVDRVRHRNEVAFVGFSLRASDAGGPVLEGSSTFLVGGMADHLPETQPAPPLERAPSFPAADTLPAPRSASRADLVRYAGATRDWNPIHWDHGAGVAAGLGGVVVHGLLQSAWLIQVAAASRPSSIRPVRSTRHRYRATLRPGEAAKITGTIGDTDAELALVCDGRTTVAGRFELEP